MRLLLVRHGRTPANVAGLLDTAYPGSELDETGRAQADQLVERLAHEPIDAIYTSDLARAQQTAAPLAAARGLAVVAHPGLREIQAGDYEMAGDATGYLQVLRHWFTDPHTRMPGPGGETGAETIARVDSAFAAAAGDGHERIVAVSHGAVMAIWVLARAANMTPELLRTVSRENGVVVELNGWPGGDWRVVRWGERVLS